MRILGDRAPPLNDTHLALLFFKDRKNHICKLPVNAATLVEDSLEAIFASGETEELVHLAALELLISFGQDEEGRLKIRRAAEVPDHRVGILVFRTQQYHDS